MSKSYSSQPFELAPVSPGFVWTFPGVVERVIDGDTIEMRIMFSPMAVHDTTGVAVRVEGINALEASEKFGGEATAKARSLLPVGAVVTLISRRRDKYGRFLARITLSDGSDFSTTMLTAVASDGTTRLAVPYAG